MAETKSPEVSKQTPPQSPVVKKAPEFSFGEKITTGSPRIRSMLIMGSRMIGKTRLLTQLPKSLTIDIPGHAQNYESVGNVFDLQTEMEKKNKQLVQAAQGGPSPILYNRYTFLLAYSAYLAKTKIIDFINLDSLTDLEEVCLPKANQLYRKTSEGANYTGDNVVADIGYGKGQTFLKEAAKPIITNLLAASKICTIFTGHVTVKNKPKKTKEEVDTEETDVDLTSQIKKLIAGQVEATALMYRAANGAQNILSFENYGDTIIIGGRPGHLQNQKFVISEMFDEEDNLSPTGSKLVTHWKSIFPELN